MGELRIQDLTGEERETMGSILASALLVRPGNSKKDGVDGICMKFPFKKRHILNALMRKGWIKTWTAPMEGKNRDVPTPEVYILVSGNALQRCLEYSQKARQGGREEQYIL